MIETIDELRRKEILLVNVVYMAESQDETSDYWRRGRYVVEQILTQEQHLIAIPSECLNSIFGKNLASSLICCSKKAMEKSSERYSNCNIVFDVRNKTVRVTDKEFQI